MGIYEIKVLIYRLSQAAFILAFGLFFILILLNVVTFGALFSLMLPSFIVVFVVTALNMATFFLFFRGKDERRIMLEGWESMKKGNLFTLGKAMEINDSFEKIPGENIVFPLTPCFYSAVQALSFTKTVRDVIVTDKRILIGFHTSIPLLQKETFGNANLWRSDVPEIPKMSSSIAKILGGDSKISKISYEERKEGAETAGFLKVSVSSGALWADIDIYHPKAKEICGLFSAPSSVIEKSDSPVSAKTKQSRK